MVVLVQEIKGTERSVRQLLAHTRYGLDYYQREYSWREEEVRELLDDLVGRFLDDFDRNHDRSQVASYRPYCLGPIVTAKRGATQFLVDGQQRITTLTLLLIHLRRILNSQFSDEHSILNDLIFSSAFGKTTFNLDVKEREACLRALLDGESFDTHDQSTSVRNLWDRYRTITDRFPHDDIDADVLPYFIDWLTHRVILIDIEASRQPQAGLEAVFYNAQNGFTLQLPLILAAITPIDDNSVYRQKAAMIARAVDIFIARRMVNYRQFGYSTVVYTMFNLMKSIRNRSIEDIQGILLEWLASEKEQLSGIERYGLTQRNRKHIRYILARITAWLDSELESEGTVFGYLNRNRKNPYEVEHIWADHYEQHENEFDNPHDFARHRNRIGDLVLLPKDFNASYGDMPYEQKVQHYIKQNSLVRSLHPLEYKNNPTFRRLLDTLPFRPYPDQYTKDDIVERQHLYMKIAERVWDPRLIVVA